MNEENTMYENEATGADEIQDTAAPSEDEQMIAPDEDMGSVSVEEAEAQNYLPCKRCYKNNE